MNRRRYVVLGLLFCLGICLFTACGKDTSAAAMCLVRTEGTVEVADGEGNEISLAKNLSLYDGYHVETQTAAFAWINLDKAKLTKLDAESEVEVRKEERHLELVVNRGSLFFNVTEPLTEEESLDIRISDMAVGIRGTCGWVSVQDATHLQAYILEGTVECRLEGADVQDAGTVSVSGGEVADLAVIDGEVKILVRRFSQAEIPEFVWQELEEDDATRDRINGAFGMDVVEWFHSAVTLKMPVTDLEVQAYLDQDDFATVVIEPGEGDNIFTVENEITIRDNQTLIIEDGISVYLDGTEEDTAFFSAWGTLKMQGDLVVGIDGFFACDGIAVIDGNVTIYGAFQNYATTIIAGRADVLPETREGGDSYVIWSGASLENLIGYLYVGEGIWSEGEVVLQEGAELNGTITLQKGAREVGGRTWDTEGRISRRDANGAPIDEE